ncbi:C40 family peptidase [Alicyclobacillus cycloheptanicus]|uniref:Cell wall-associated NlpC family hydrolase n=1 Tax=Alicyclobacillus cycloheptanicus TaxID=1457 RepID=A0ABT9XM74_9BACL|nr:NlpC/P60 family protein [Alicyclobacillus cycloheptanicus]MDQ0190801.1 cell wall-associated NlpC family hydrolase [Alicyclobacillus cycloheptanicus]WDM02717.1 C40 family peptidase [Alicyclobacillus cycloheptanicus]
MTRPGKRMVLYAGGLLLVCVVVALVWTVRGVKHDSAAHTKGGKSPSVVITVAPAEPVAQYRQDTIYKTTEQLLAEPPDQQLDASAFVQYVYARAGISLPRTVQEQAQTGTPISDPAQLHKGDLVFFSDSPTDTQVTFDGIYIGNDTVAALTTHGLQTFKISDAYWQPLFRFGVTPSQASSG